MYKIWYGLVTVLITLILFWCYLSALVAEKSNSINNTLIKIDNVRSPQEKAIDYKKTENELKEINTTKIIIVGLAGLTLLGNIILIRKHNKKAISKNYK
jgi:low temperature requirement protein LtrA